MPSYNVKQIAYTSSGDCVQSVPVDVYNVQGSAQTGDDPRVAPYQQIVVKPRPANDASTNQVFSMNKTYYLSLTIPKNQNYDLQYAIRLVKLPETEIGDLDSANYQFIRYITSRKVSDGEMESSWVALFQQKDLDYNPDDPMHDQEYFGDIMAAIPEEVEIPITLQANPSPYIANTLYKNGDLYFWCTSDGQYWPARSGAPVSNVGKSDALLSHSWIMSQTELTDTYNIIFKPRVADLDAIYLHLIPIPEDNDIQWQLEQAGVEATYYGRHIDIDSLQVNLYELKDLLDVTARRLGIWGHPGLMFHIEGEEIKIGPSGYYELHDFTVNELGIAAFGPEDKFTIDIQYS